MFGDLGGIIDNIGGTIDSVAGTMRQIGDMGTQLQQIKNIISFARKGGDPMNMIQSFAQNNPQAKQMLQNLNGKSPDELKAYAENMAKSYGTDINSVIKSLGING